MALIVAFLRANWLRILFGVLILFAIWKIDQNGYNRAKRQAEAAEAARVELERKIIAAMEAKIGEAVDAIDQRTADRIGQIDSEERTIVMPTIREEVRRDPRYSDPAAGVSAGMLDAINRARSASHPAASGARR